MNPTTTILDIRARLAPNEKAVILAYGSSNTERFLPGMHWFDVLELALRDTYGRFHQCINAGLCGDTSRGLLQRFAREAAQYQPRLAIVTIGGNDSNPVTEISAAQFSRNLLDLHARFAALGCQTVFQTYYSPDPARKGDLTAFYAYMEIVRQTARATGSGLVDHLVRWEAFRRVHPERYLAMMLDGFHVNPHGNVVLGLDLARSFGAVPAPHEPGRWDDALAVQRIMDELQPPVA